MKNNTNAGPHPRRMKPHSLEMRRQHRWFSELSGQLSGQPSAEALGTRRRQAGPCCSGQRSEGIGAAPWATREAALMFLKSSGPGGERAQGLAPGGSGSQEHLQLSQQSSPRLLLIRVGTRGPSQAKALDRGLTATPPSCDSRILLPTSEPHYFGVTSSLLGRCS